MLTIPPIVTKPFVSPEKAKIPLPKLDMRRVINKAIKAVKTSKTSQLTNILIENERLKTEDNIIYQILYTDISTKSNNITDRSEFPM